jgi:hypothetical protein
MGKMECGDSRLGLSVRIARSQAAALANNAACYSSLANIGRYQLGSGPAERTSETLTGGEAISSVPQLVTVLHLVAAGLGVSLMAASLQAPQVRGAIFKAVCDASPYNPLGPRLAAVRYFTVSDDFSVVGLQKQSMTILFVQSSPVAIHQIKKSLLLWGDAARIRDWMRSLWCAQRR